MVQAADDGTRNHIVAHDQIRGYSALGTFPRWLEILGATV
jgi:hypothetical protein